MLPSLKSCRRCGVIKSALQFGRAPRNRGGLHSWCRECENQRKRERYTEKRAAGLLEPGHDALYTRRYRLKRYGINEETFEKLLAYQEGRCAICREPFDRVPTVDHDHRCCPEPLRSCGSCIRGLLCRGCNHGLGNFQDDIEVLLRAALYLSYAVRGRLLPVGGFDGTAAE